MNFDEKLLALADEADEALRPRFEAIARVSRENTARVLSAFAAHRVDAACFGSTDGYGYDDRGRDTLDAVFAQVTGAEAAFVRHSIVSGTHALTIGLFGLLRPGDILLSAAGKPYDTLSEVIGLAGEAGNGSLADFGVSYRQIEMKEGKTLDLPALRAFLESEEGARVKVVFIQRSKGYLLRRTLTVDEIGQAARLVKSIRPDAFLMVDNCYGEFTETVEPPAVGADLTVGSLIKNPGGGMAASGGYLAGTRRAVELASYRLTCPGIGLEEGASLSQNKNLFRGLFFAPHTVAEALKTAHFAAYIFEKLGCRVDPAYDEPRSDIIQTVITGSREGLCAICRGIQAGSPVDAYVTPVPYAMPGYQDDVIMAAGAFVQGSSLELSADGPLRPPYTAYLQGGLTFESGRIGILSAAATYLAEGKIKEKEERK
ncbi:MAG: methionine gamma-lyase family protein [Eubacteriales bacterium]|nr:methionine gamma-lyase family protein [Eubacteriales bacterium]MDY2826502.1 methionine gamma-lyase family protein [Eubacteriales bacterium]